MLRHVIHNLLIIMLLPPPKPTLFPYTTLFRSTVDPAVLLFTLGVSVFTGLIFGLAPLMHTRVKGLALALKEGGAKGDRKSTRLNSSHGYTSYAVFCLKINKARNMCL